MFKALECDLEKLNDTWRSFFLKEFEESERRLAYLMKFSEEDLEFVSQLTIEKIEYLVSYDGKTIYNFYAFFKKKGYSRGSLFEFVYEKTTNKYTIYEPIDYNKSQQLLIESCLNRLNFKQYLTK
ncbi:hypothetical protein [Bacillus thuringiensis]|uniref:hypothetical protein n=1 Tax=Bacillus thuringiensis TaxID=1428 RepID=UPI0021D66D81|nr:hypothetical protein [Bacillus thuringiensis]MCU7666949.1 hypothetical protein [Bacillus thuringiensis]